MFINRNATGEHLCERGYKLCKKGGQLKIAPKVKPTRLDWPWSLCLRLLLLSYFRLELSRTKNSNYSSNISQRWFVILCCSYHTNVFLSHHFLRYHDWHQSPAWDLAGTWYRSYSAWSLSPACYWLAQKLSHYCSVLGSKLQHSCKMAVGISLIFAQWEQVQTPFIYVIALHVYIQSHKCFLYLSINRY